MRTETPAPYLPSQDRRLYGCCIRQSFHSFHHQHLQDHAGYRCQAGKPSLKRDSSHAYDVSGIIGLSGSAQGSIKPQLPESDGAQDYLQAASDGNKVVGPELSDGIGELTNIVAGSAKAELANLTKHSLSVSLPNVVLGSGHTVTRPSNLPGIMVPFSSLWETLRWRYQLKRTDSADRLASPLQTQPMQSRSKDSMKILLVDDSTTMRRIQRNQIETLGIKDIIEAGDGREALTVLKDNMPIDVILLDWNMPVMDGFTFLKEVRAQESYKNIKIVMCTSESEKRGSWRR